AAALLAATAADAKPLNPNADFEADDVGWMVTGRQEGSVAERTDRAAFDSGYGYALRGMDRGGIVQNAVVSEPGIYAVTAMVRSVGEDGHGGQGWGLAEMTLTGFDAAGKTLAGDFYITKAVKPGWRRLATILDLTDAKDLARVQLAVTVAGLSGVRELQIDDVRLYRVDP